MGSFLEWMLESSLLVLMILGIRKIFMGKIRYAGIYALWIVVLLRFMIPVNVISSPLSVENMISRAESLWTSGEDSRQKDEESDVLGKDRNVGQENGGVIDVDSTGKISEKYQQVKSTDTQKERGILSKKSEDGKKTAFPGFMKMLIKNWKPILAGGWFAISCLLLLWFFLSNRKLVGELKQNRVLYGKKDGLKIYAASGIKSPCLYGFIRPVIYLPKNMVLGDGEERVREEELQQIITHEYVHYCHKDHIWAMIRMLLVSLYWFHPFLWLAVSCSKKDAELFCDETVIRLLGEEQRFCYGEMLVRLAGDARWGDFRYSMTPMSRRGKEMETRIRAISTKRQYSKWLLIPLAAVLCVAVNITCSAGMSSLAGQEDTKQTEQIRGGEQDKTEGEGKEQQQGKKSQEEIDKQVSIYGDFLKVHGKEEKFRYYSLVWFGASEDGHVGLVTSRQLNKISAEPGKSNGWWGSNACEIYNIVNGKVVFCGNLTCDGGKVIRWENGKLQIYHQNNNMNVDLNPESEEMQLKEGNVNHSQSIQEDSSEKQDWAAEYEGWRGVVFYTNPYIGGSVGEAEPQMRSLQNDVTPYLELENKTYAPVYSSTYKEAFQHYIEIFTEAVNTGNTDNMSKVLAVGSQVYEQQCALVKNYYKRGIREEVKSSTISSVKEVTEDSVEVHSKEKIKVFYADSTSKMVKQKYRYTCEYLDGNWIITKMEEISITTK